MAKEPSKMHVKFSVICHFVLKILKCSIMMLDLNC